jgi:hypothetical protein
MRAFPLTVPNVAALAVLIGVAALGALNPVDALVRGKWVRAVDTGKGAMTATLCIPAASHDELESFYAELPERIRALHAAGASVVALDLELPNPPAALLDAASAGKTVFPHSPGAPPAGTDRASGTTGMARTWFLPMVLGVEARSALPAPLAIAALALHAGVAPVLDADGGARVGELRAAADGGSLNFMPFEVPFIHWSDRSTWEVARGRIVFVGACKADRDLTRFGRQPGVVAHSELIETMRVRRVVGQVPRVADVALALGVFGVAALSGRRWGRWAALGVGGLGVAAAMAASLTGHWLGLSGPLLAGWLRHGAASGRTARGAPRRSFAGTGGVRARPARRGAPAARYCRSRGPDAVSVSDAADRLAWSSARSKVDHAIVPSASVSQPLLLSTTTVPSHASSSTAASSGCRVRVAPRRRMASSSSASGVQVASQSKAPLARLPATGQRRLNV